jgi:uncharacterized protein (TIGR03086 family)
MSPTSSQGLHQHDDDTGDRMQTDSVPDAVRFDLTPAARRVAALVQAVPDDALSGTTPCAGLSLADLADHVDGLALAFTWGATKHVPPGGSPPPSADGSRLEPGWRDRISRQLEQLAEAWRDAGAWMGLTEVGGVRLPGAAAAAVALDELVVHGWDVAMASGQAYDVPADEVAVCHEFVAQAQGAAEPSPGLFGPPASVPDDASPLERLIGLTGRDPGWSPAR